VKASSRDPASLSATRPLSLLRPGPAAWLPAAKRSNGAMLLHHLGDMHPTEVGPYLKRMETEDIATVAAKAYEVVAVEEIR
jgi:hypothetical protein